MGELKTKPNDASVLEFIDTVEDPLQKEDSLTLLGLFEEVTKHPAKMWGTAIIGFDQYHYKSERSTQEGDWPRIAFSPRKGKLTLYLMPGLERYASMLDELGPHKTSKGCLYITRLKNVDMAILKQVLEASYKDALAEL